MFLGLAVFLVLALVVSILVIRLIKSLVRLLAGNGKKEKETEREKEEKKEAEGKVPKESVSESESQSESLEAGQDPISEEIRNRFATSEKDGISETFWTQDTDLAIDSKTVADLSVGTSSLTYLEFNNRSLAGDDFFGFNLIIEEDTRIVLTYNGLAVASITKVETEATAIVNGQQVEGTGTSYRVNTFPPDLRPGMTLSDIEAMLDAAERVRACGGDPRLVADVMLSEFTDPLNVSKLKGAVDRKIQSKETARKEIRQQERKTQARRLA